MSNARPCAVCDLLLAPIWVMVALLFPIFRIPPPTLRADGWLLSGVFWVLVSVVIALRLD